MTRFLDAEKAFDTVSHRGSLKKRIDYKFLRSIRLLHAYLRNRKIRVKLNSKLSEKLCIRADVSQGSEMGPILFFVFINGMPAITRLLLGIYTDDMVLYVKSKCNESIVKYLNTTLQALQNWCLPCRIKINTAKFKSGFSSIRKSLIPETPGMFEKSVKWRSIMKYHIQSLQKNRKFNLQVNDARAKATMFTSRLHPIINQNSSVEPNYGILIYKTFIKFILAYACTVCGGTSTTNMKQIQIVH